MLLNSKQWDFNLSSTQSSIIQPCIWTKICVHLVFVKHAYGVLFLASGRRKKTVRGDGRVDHGNLMAYSCFKKVIKSFVGK